MLENAPQSDKLNNKILKIVHHPLFKLALFSTTAMTVLGSMVISPSLPGLQGHFQDVPNINFLSKLVLTLPALFVMVCSPLIGCLLDRYGKLKFLFPAIIVWSIAGASGFFLDNIYLILFSRSIFGIATAFTMTCSTSLVGDYYFGEDRKKAVGLQAFATALSSALFVTLGGWLSNMDWRYPFLVYLLGIFIGILAYLKLFEPRQHKSKTTQSISSGVEKFHFFRFLPVYLLVVLCMNVYYISPTQIPFFIVHNLGKSADVVGISMSASSVAYGAFALFYRFLKNTLDIFKIYSLSFFSMGSAFLLLFLFHNHLIVIIALVFLGAGAGLIIVNSNFYLLLLVSEKQRARALGFLASSIFLGQFSSPLISQPIVDAVGILYMFLTFNIVLYLFGLFFLFKKMRIQKTETMV